MPVKSLLILVLLCLLAWLPVVFGAYSSVEAIFVILSGLLGGAVAPMINNRKDENVMIIKPVLILVPVCLLVWLPVVFGVYSNVIALILTYIFLIAGFLRGIFLYKEKGENKSP